ncbi:MAG: hypothetical protein Q9195_007269 [Heterodermia aff. obscurata]
MFKRLREGRSGRPSPGKASSDTLIPTTAAPDRSAATASRASTAKLPSSQEHRKSSASSTFSAETSVPAASRANSVTSSFSDATTLLAPRDSRISSVSSLFSGWSRNRSPTPTLPSRSPSRRRSSPSPGPASKALGQLGLHVLHQPETAPLFNIILIHGLGGDSRKTWTKDLSDPDLFWPQRWLPLEPDIGRARILSFGYNASFLPGTPRSIYKIVDFAKELLFEMKFAKDNNGQDLDIGSRPIIVLAHSMGGLVAKKAYLLGQIDETYQDIVRSISAIVFLATPHRGSNLAEVLSRLLTVFFQPSREFISDLTKGSHALEELNEQFRHVAPKLSIWSFYETQATPVGPANVMVLDKDSSILGYTKEVSRPLNADHHGVCKYSSPEDSNYISVRNALSSLAKDLSPRDLATRGQPATDTMKNLEDFLGVHVSPEEDLNSIRRLWLSGTCDWLLHEPQIKSWMETRQESCVTWFSGPPGSGKSTLSAHMIIHMRSSNAACQYFFFKFDDPSKRSLSSFLRSIAYQAAKDIPDFQRDLMDLAADNTRLEKADSLLIWKKLFESTLLRLDLTTPLYWVIDALDESEAPKALLELLHSIGRSRAPIRVLIFSRKTEPLSVAFGRLPSSIPVQLLDKDGTDFNALDIHTLIEEEIQHMRGSDELRQKVAQSVESRAQGSFLWARLVLEDIVNCHSEDAIQDALRDIPNDMNDLYRRMELSILNSPRKSNIALAKAILQWVTCARRLLTLEELSQALRPEIPELLDPRRTIQDVCGQFTVINDAGQVAVVHQTAREYLTKNSGDKSFVNIEEAHAKLFRKSISVLCDPTLRYKLTHSPSTLRTAESFLFYAAISWTYHLQHIRIPCNEILDSVLQLFKSTSVLTWIQFLALFGPLETLVKAAKALTSFVRHRRKFNSTENPLLHRLSDLDLLERWTVDLVKLIGKFSRQLSSDPSIIYNLIPALCPKYSILHQQYFQRDATEIAIRGISDTHWNDNLAKIALPNGDQAWNIACAADILAVHGSSGTVYIWNASNFSEICTVRHKEPVTSLCINSKGSVCVTYGLRSTKFWSIPSAQMLSCTPNPADVKAMSMTFAENDAKVLMGSDDRAVRYLQTKEPESGWQVVDASLLKESSQPEGSFVNSPMCMAFNGDGTQVGVSYRGFPLSVWVLKGGYCIGRCQRAKAFRNDHARPSASWFGVDRFTWNPVTGHVIGLYRDGCVFKWHPLTGENQEAPSAADEVAASSDGKMFVTSNSDGTVRLWNFAYFTVIYQLSSTDLVTGLAFSPDCMRIYDLRGSFVNAWEPNSLIRFSESEESSSDTASESQSPTSVSHISEASLRQYEAITVVSAEPGSHWYCAGNEEGSVDLFNTRTDHTVELSKFFNYMSVAQIAWSQDATHIATADLGGDIAVKHLTAPPVNSNNGTPNLKSLSPPRIDLDGRGIQQMLFNTDASLLLIASDDGGHIWSLKNQTTIATLHDADMNRRWLQHPLQESLFLGFGPSDIKVFCWQDFSEQARLYQSRTELETAEHPHGITKTSPKPDGMNEARATASKALLTQDREHVLLQTKTTSIQGHVSKRVFLFPVSAFASKGSSIRSIFIPPGIHAKMEIPLGMLPGSRLAFLDRDLWFCTFRLGSSRGSEHDVPQRHYFVPRDWTSTEGVEQCCMTEDGTLLCPKDDSVAVIKCNLDISGF